MLFGGAPKSGPMLGDLWALRGLQGPDQASLRWEEVDPEGQAPHVRCSQGAATVGSDTFFFGGSYYKCAPLVHLAQTGTMSHAVALHVPVWSEEGWGLRDFSL